MSHHMHRLTLGQAPPPPPPAAAHAVLSRATRPCLACMPPYVQEGHRADHWQQCSPGKTVLLTPGNSGGVQPPNTVIIINVYDTRKVLLVLNITIYRNLQPCVFIFFIQVLECHRSDNAYASREHRPGWRACH